MDRHEGSDTIEVEPPAAKVCQSCGHVEKVETIRRVANEHCPECGSRGRRVDSWENVSGEADE